jgi:hypothetical protein
MHSRHILQSAVAGSAIGGTSIDTEWRFLAAELHRFSECAIQAAKARR